MDVAAVLGAITACVIPVWGKMPKEWLYAEKELEKKISLAEEGYKEEHARKLRIVLNNHYRQIGKEDNDFHDVLVDYCTALQGHFTKRFISQKCLGLTRRCFDWLFLSLIAGIILVICSFPAVAIANKCLCTVFLGCVAALISFQIGILCVLRKVKKEADSGVFA